MPRTALTLFNDNNALYEVSAGSQFRLPDGSVVSPAYDGWRLGLYRIGTVEIPDPPPPTPQELETEVQSIADELVQLDERTTALALATVDLAMVDIPPGATTQQVRQQFRDRVVFYLRERRGL
jgi:hypothetical protein